MAGTHAALQQATLVVPLRFRIAAGAPAGPAFWLSAFSRKCTLKNWRLLARRRSVRGCYPGFGSPYGYDECVFDRAFGFEFHPHPALKAGALPANSNQRNHRLAVGQAHATILASDRISPLPVYYANSPAVTH